MKTAQAQLQAYLTSATDGGEWSATHLQSLNRRETDLSAFRTGGWVGLRASMDGELEEEKNVAPAGN